VKPAGVGGPFTLAFLDPPYGQDLGPAALACLRDGDWLAPDAAIVLEVGAKEAPQTPGFTVIDTRDYGAAKMLFLTPEPSAK